ncbi:hypothetical protein K5E40_03710 [Pseudomonas baetica]|uniref:hypothetical protein n=1 Tax=Pseudomonas baetica TaxID=674054 RepID=UPI001C8C51B0|nr:hypothetical protein [Pseudomonas baetica]MBX9404781.1 hypothetical protein [Pseudomonas baetica]
MNKSAELSKQLVAARSYIAKLTTPQRFADRKPGYLHTLKVETQIGFQASPGDKNYWLDKEFDLALAQVIRNQFPELAAKAINLMDSTYTQARIADKENLLTALAEIEALEQAITE